ncbi:MAG TPA: ABC transporter substrate-binding protein [Xanthobacteraceae bacterium]|nr:ABC transporter substrate-binding protein [Xanthobacteraceae bacterium]
MTIYIRRREFIFTLCGAAAAWPLAAHAQQGERMRRLGVLMLPAESDFRAQALLAALRQGLLQFGWIEGRNLRIELRYSDVDFARVRANARELVGVAPDVIVTGTAPTTRALQARTKTIPIVFLSVGDPVANGFVTSISHPGGNTTGFTNLFPSIAGKWLELLKEAAPRIDRVALVFNSKVRPEIYLTPIEAAATAIGVKTIRTPVRDAADIQSALDAFAAEPDGALILVPPTLLGADREVIFRLARQHRLPAFSYDRLQLAEGSLMSYGPDLDDLWRRAASYVDRILRGEKPGDLPVQFPTKFDLVINLKTAKAIGLEIPRKLLARADDVIE